MSTSPPSRMWRVKGKQGNRTVVVNVAAPTREKAEEYARFVAKERSNLPLTILETEKKK